MLLNKDEVVAKGVQEKTGTGFLGKVAAFAANKVVSDEKIITNLSTTLMDTIKKSIEEMGILIEVTKRFQHGPLVVIQFQVLDLELLKVIEVAKGKDFANNFQNFLASASQLGLLDVITGKVYEKIYSTINDSMIKKFGELVPTKMREKGVAVDCAASSHADEALVFFDIMHRVSSL
ncbi:hypothetical protein EON64_01700 [archaeon]|nr:MAG: hypothetical protein EON64_01700 [archaeon]